LKIIIATLLITGRTNPALNVGSILVKAGHEVVFTSGQSFFSPGGVEELYPKLVGLSLEELSTVVEPFGSGIVGPPIDE
jgi:hypothetical protein